MKFAIALVVACCAAVPGQYSWSQEQNNRNLSGYGDEYIRSTSPLSNGTTVTSTYLPGQNIRTEVGVSSTTANTQNRSVLNQQITPVQETSFQRQPVTLASQQGLSPPPMTLPQPGQTPAVANQVPTLGNAIPVSPAPLHRRGFFGCNCNQGFAPQINYALAPGITGAAGSANYRNMPPGTYLGRGFLGQPKAYVDGQPVRNLLRFVTF